MSEEFVRAYEQFSKNPSQVEKELKNCIGKVYKFVYDGVTFYIEVEHYRGLDKIGVTHHSSGESIFDEWDAEHFYEIIKYSEELDNKE